MKKKRDQNESPRNYGYLERTNAITKYTSHKDKYLQSSKELLKISIVSDISHTSQVYADKHKQ